MDSRFGHLFVCLLMVILSIQPTHSVKETLLDFGINANGGSPTANYIVFDNDADGIKPTVDDVSGQILVRTATMPDFANLAAYSNRENNYVFMPFIANPTGNIMVKLEYTFSHEKVCPPYGQPNVQCNNYVTLLLVNTTSSANVSSIPVFTNSIYSVNLTNSATSHDETKTALIRIPAGTSGYRLVLHDGGSEFNLKVLTLHRFYCQYSAANNALPIRCPDIPASRTNSAAQCVCDDQNSLPHNGLSTIPKVCQFNSFGSGSADFAHSSASCDCKPGYVYTQRGTSSTRYCEVKPSTLTTPTTTTTTTTYVPPSHSTKTSTPKSMLSTLSNLNLVPLSQSVTVPMIPTTRETSTAGCGRSTVSSRLAILSLLTAAAAIY